MQNPINMDDLGVSRGKPDLLGITKGMWGNGVSVLHQSGLSSIWSPEGVGKAECFTSVWKTYWCLAGNGWECGNGIIIHNYYGSFPHSLRLAQKMTSICCLSAACPMPTSDYQSAHLCKATFRIYYTAFNQSINQSINPKEDLLHICTHFLDFIKQVGWWNCRIHPHLLAKSLATVGHIPLFLACKILVRMCVWK